MSDARTIRTLQERSDDDIIRIWLAERGLVAVERKLMDDLVGFAGETCGAVYNATHDRYEKREKVAA